MRWLCSGHAAPPSLLTVPSRVHRSYPTAIFRFTQHIIELCKHYGAQSTFPPGCARALAVLLAELAIQHAGTLLSGQGNKQIVNEFLRLLVYFTAHPDSEVRRPAALLLCR